MVTWINLNLSTDFYGFLFSSIWPAHLPCLWAGIWILHGIYILYICGSYRIHTFTCDSVIPNAYASFARSGPARYLVCSNVFSNAKICWPLNVGRVCFFLPSLSELWCCDRLADTGKKINKWLRNSNRDGSSCVLESERGCTPGSGKWHWHNSLIMIIMINRNTLCWE